MCILYDNIICTCYNMCLMYVVTCVYMCLYMCLTCAFMYISIQYVSLPLVLSLIIHIYFNIQMQVGYMVPFHISSSYFMHVALTASVYLYLCNIYTIIIQCFSVIYFLTYYEAECFKYFIIL